MEPEMELEFFFKPRSIAVIGASATAGKVGNAVMRNLRERHGDIQVFGINPKGGEIEGFKVYKSVLDVPVDIDLAVMCIPARYVLDVIDEIGEKGIRGLIIITAGFKEVGSEGYKLEREMMEKCKKYGIRVLGPNCLGMISLFHNSSFAALTPKKGSIAMISQSGAVMTAILDWSTVHNIGFSTFISLGNKSDVNETDFIQYLAHDPETKIIACYLEAIDDGERFIKIVSEASRRKPVIILKSGVSEAGAMAASSHTGSLAGSDIAYDLAFEKAGVIRAKELSELFSYAKTFTMCDVPASNRFAIITNAGGPGIIATDAFEDYNVGVARFSQDTLEQLRDGLPAEAGIFNPVDIVGDAPPDRYDFALRTVLKEPMDACAGTLIILTPQANTHPLDASNIMIKVHEDFKDRIMIAAFMGGKSVKEGADNLMDHGIPCCDFPEEAIRNISGLITFSKFRDRSDETKIKPLTVNRDRIREIIETARQEKRPMLLNYETSDIFSEYAIPHPKTKLARTPGEARQFATEIGFPVVMKIVSPQVVHKSDIGGVILGIKNEEEAQQAFINILSSVQELRPDAQIHGIEVQEMIMRDEKKKVTELIIGMSRDPQFGPLIMFGMGGIYVNFMKDVSFKLGKFFTVEDSREIIEETKTHALLRGVRGEPPSDLKEVEVVLQKISLLVNEFPDILELDINPLLAFAKGEGVSAVDIKITIKI
ncbi:CoA-binding protein [Candidatus Bathyarchaeota archaeon]|nr:CoA-binding protein [Candidatus Bathyarchaeota archaeon]